MKKRVFCLLMALVLLLGLLPAPARAEEDTSHNHPVCGETCGHGNEHATVTWKALSQDSFTGGADNSPEAGSGVTVPTISGDNYILDTGNYYLTGNIAVNKEIRITNGTKSDTVNLCLNGYTLTSTVTGNPAITVPGNVTLWLCDCQSGGKIASAADSLLKIGTESGTAAANLYGGTLESNGEDCCVQVYSNLTLDGATLKASGYAINTAPNSSVTIKSGTVESNNTKQGQSYGVNVQTANFTMTGGEIKHTANGEAAVHFVTSGGTISGGTITSMGNYGILLSTSGTVTLSGSPTISGKTAGIAIGYAGLITVGADLTGTYTVYKTNPGSITEPSPFPFTTASNADHSALFSPAPTGMAGVGVRNGGEGSAQKVELYREHGYSSGWTYDATQHWKACSNPGCTAPKNDLANHNKVWNPNGMTQHWQMCTVCSWTGEKTDHAGAGNWVTNDKAHWKLCSCGSRKSMDLAVHSYDDDQDADCNVCGYTRAVPLYGTVTVTGTPKLGVPLTASVTGAPQGVTLKYAWTITGGDGTVLGAAATYTPTANEVGKTLTVTVTTDNPRYTGSISAVTADVAKGDQAAPAGIFTITDAAYGQSTGTIAIAGDAAKLEYRLKPMDGSDPAWSTAASSNQLATGTYEFRYKETATHNASPTTDVQVRVLDPNAKRLTIAEITHGTVEKRRDMVNPGDTVTLAVKPDDGYKLTAIAATYNDGTADKTITPTVKPDNPRQYTFTMPNADVTITAIFSPTSPDKGEAKGEVEVVDGTPQVSVDTNILKELAGTPTANQTITVKLTVEKQDAPEDKAEIERVLAAGTKNDVLYLDLSLQKIIETTGGGMSMREPIYNAARVLAVVVPYDFTGKQRVTVYRCHSGKAEALAEASTRADGTFALDKSNGTVTIYASKFSTYAIGYTAAGQAATYTLTVNGGTGSGSYAADTIVKISATVPSGQRFTGWTGAAVANSGSASTTLVMPAQNTTVTANFQKISDGGGGGGSGGSDSTTYPVETSGADGGKVTVSPKNAASGTTVTLTLTPDAGYAAGGVTVTDGNGKQIVVTAIGDRKYTFTMPSGKVTVTGVFIKITDGYQDCPRDRTCPIWPYTDANPKAWYHDGVHYCLANGIMVGTSETTFEPNANTTRGQVVTMLYRVEQEPAAAVSAKFKDVLDGMYYTQAVAWAEANGIVEGHSEVRFAPDDRVTREQLGAILYRYARFKGRAADERGSLDGFADGGTVSAYAREAMRWAVGSGLMEGDKGGLRPAGNATRAETATLFWRFLNKWTDG